MAGRLTTHVLDTSTGRPAAGVALTLTRLPEAIVLAQRTTNADGRVDGAMLEDEAFRPGVYELAFHVGDYFRRGGVALGDPAFLDIVPIRFGLSAEGHCHVPLLVSPFGYSTYRGS
jgi:5-hydroxyisourate hydrolase